MSIQDAINQELTRLSLFPLAGEQVQCLLDRARVEEAEGMLADLRDRCGVRLPLPRGTPLSGPHSDESTARDAALPHIAEYLVVGVDRMATDDSRSNGNGDEYYVTGYTGADAAIALAEQRDHWVACWIHGKETAPPGN